MLQIKALSRYLNLQESFRLYYILALGAFLSIFSFVLYQDFIVTATVIACTIAGYIVLSRPPREIMVTITPDALTIDDNYIDITRCTGYAIVDLGDTVEFTIETKTVGAPYFYFYVKESEENFKQLIIELSKYMPYDEQIPIRNVTHSTLRRFGLK